MASESNAVALRPVERAEVDVIEPGGSLLPGSGEISVIKEIAKWAAASAYWEGNTPEKAAMQILAGREYGLGPWQSLSGMHIIKGKPSLAADTMFALVLRYLKRVGGGEFRVTDNTAASCTVTYRRPEWDEASTVTWTIEEARTAGLVAPGGNWAKYPRSMLRHRAIAEAARSGFPDVCAGLYDDDEIEPAPIRPVTQSDAEQRPTQIREKTRRTVKQDGAVVDTETGEVVEKSDARLAMDHLHATGEERGYDHDALHLLGWATGVDSLTRLSPAQLRDLAAWIKESDDAAIRIEIARGRELKEWTEKINGAANLLDLESIGQELKAAEVSSDGLRAAYHLRRGAFLKAGG